MSARYHREFLRQEGTRSILVLACDYLSRQTSEVPTAVLEGLERTAVNYLSSGFERTLRPELTCGLFFARQYLFHDDGCLSGIPVVPVTPAGCEESVLAIEADCVVIRLANL